MVKSVRVGLSAQSEATHLLSALTLHSSQVLTLIRQPQTNLRPGLAQGWVLRASIYGYLVMGRGELWEMALGRLTS